MRNKTLVTNVIFPSLSDKSFYQGATKIKTAVPTCDWRTKCSNLISREATLLQNETMYNPKY